MRQLRGPTWNRLTTNPATATGLAPVRSHRHHLRVIYGDTDRMGIVYYANYLRYFEAGRNELLRAAGVDYRALEAGGTYLPVAEAQARYRSPAYYDDQLELTTSVAQVGTSSIRIEYALRRSGDDVLVATGFTRHACVNGDGRVTRVPEFVREKLDGDDHGKS